MRRMENLLMIGRTVLAKSGEAATILDWRGSDIEAEQMCITVGTTRPPLSNGPFFFGTYGPRIQDGILETAVGGTVNQGPAALIEYGIGGFSQVIVIDAFPEQTIVVPASFIRVQVYNGDFPAGAQVEFFATVSRGIGKTSIPAKWSTSTLVGAGIGYEQRMPPYAKEFMVSRVDNVTELSGPIVIEWRNEVLGGAIVQRLSFSAVDDIPVLRVPGNASKVRVSNPGANAQRVVATWFMEP